MPKNFPEIAFGKCTRCGSKSGADYPASDLTSADSQSNLDIVGNGVTLVWFRGDLMCDVCIKEIIQREESNIDRYKREREETFRAKSGFKNTV